MRMGILTFHWVLEEKCQFSLIGYHISCGLFINGFYCIKETSFKIYLLSFYHEWLLYLNAFSVSIDMITWVFLNISFCEVVYHID